MRDEHIITRQGKQYVLYAGLLDHAKGEGLCGIETELVQVPGAENGNVAIVKAVVFMDVVDEYSPTGDRQWNRYTGIGDASPDNVGKNIVPHIIRMAETRAKARALRDAINLGHLLLEDDPSDEDRPAPAQQAPERPPLDVDNLASPEQQGYLKGLLRDLGMNRAAFEYKHGAISTFSVGRASAFIERLQARLDKQNMAAE